MRNTLICRSSLLCVLAVPAVLVAFVPVAAVCAETARAAALTTPAGIGILSAQEQIAKEPEDISGYNSLAMAYVRRARETAESTYYSKAEDTLAQSFQREPENFEGLKVRTFLLLGGHEFAKALELATALNKRVPDDISIRGYLVDANTELGNYDDAVRAAQWMLNLRPGNAAGMTRAAHLRELHGDLSGALAGMQAAYNATSPGETEELAWLLARISHLHLLSGDLHAAESYARSALDLFSDYPDALFALAKMRMAANRSDDAVSLFEKLCAVSPRAVNEFALAEALIRAGRTDAADRVFAQFEEEALRESGSADNANHELVIYYVDYVHEPARAREIATQEMTRRQDAFTRAAYAWSLAACGDYSAASAEMKKALAFGISDPEILRRADEITGHAPQPIAASR